MLSRGLTGTAHRFPGPHRDEPPKLDHEPWWTKSQHWKIHFVVLAVLMFSAYAGISALLEQTGWRPRRVAETLAVPDARLDCNGREMTLEARAACIVARDSARNAERKLRHEKEAREYAKRQAEKKALDEAIKRQRALARNKRMKADYDARMGVISSPATRFDSQVERAAFREATLKTLIGLLASTEGHPAKALSWKLESLRPSDAIAVINMEGKEKVDVKIGAEVEDICGARQETNWREHCGRILTEYVVQLPIYTTQYHLSALIASIPAGENK
jgi:hypothetical protein